VLRKEHRNHGVTNDKVGNAVTLQAKRKNCDNGTRKDDCCGGDFICPRPKPMTKVENN
jgi:hypothetical protein